MIKPPNTGTTLLEYDRQLTTAVAFLNGKELTLSTAATGAAQKLPHGLGRAYRGGWQLSTSGVGSVLIVLDPSEQDDAAVNVTFIDAAAAATTTRLWVY